MEFKDAFEKIGLLKTNLRGVLRGKDSIVDLSLATLLSGGHLLIEDVPGVGKTTLAHGLARSINCQFHRIQFTSDLLPSDVIGTTIYSQTDHSFVFRPGPVFANIILADEINRATPKTQSALLEAMSDRQVSVDKKTHALPRPFMLLATQNPVEFSGTFPLPESQLDRFAMCVKIGYPDEGHEREIIRSSGSASATDRLAPVASASDIGEMQAVAAGVKVDDDLVDYILKIANATREHRGIRLGVSPRATSTMYRAAQAFALVSGREYCIPDDIKLLCRPIFAHRIVPSERTLDAHTEASAALIDEILAKTTVPV